MLAAGTSTHIVQTTGTILNVMTVLERVRTGLLKEEITGYGTFASHGLDLSVALITFVNELM